MTRLRSLGIVLLLLALSLPAARAGGANGVLRFLGLGWSDGYHAHNDCQPHHRSFRFSRTGGHVPTYGYAPSPHFPPAAPYAGHPPITPLFEEVPPSPGPSW